MALLKVAEAAPDAVTKALNSWKKILPQVSINSTLKRQNISFDFFGIFGKIITMH